MLVIMGLEERKLLVAVDGVAGIVDVENDALRNEREAVAEQVVHRQPRAPRFAPRWGILKVRQGRLAHHIAGRPGQTPAGQLEGRVEVQNVVVVAILVPASDVE